MKVRPEKIAAIIFSSIKIKILKVFPNSIIYKFITVGTILYLLISVNDKYILILNS
jgi:hypothetical protein